MKTGLLSFIGEIQGYPSMINFKYMEKGCFLGQGTKAFIAQLMIKLKIQNS